MGSGAGLAVMPAAAACSASKHFIDGFSEALRADLAGTGVVVTQVCPGPVESEFDTVAGSVGGMTGAPPPWLRIAPRSAPGRRWLASTAASHWSSPAPVLNDDARLAFAPRGLQRRRAPARSRARAPAGTWAAGQHRWARRIAAPMTRP